MRRRVYAVVPGIGNSLLIVIEDSNGAPAIVGRIPVGEVATGVAVNTRTNRLYETNRGYELTDTLNDTVTVINGNDLTVIDTITVGRSLLGAMSYRGIGCGWQASRGLELIHLHGWRDGEPGVLPQDLHQVIGQARGLTSTRKVNALLCDVKSGEAKGCGGPVIVWEQERDIL